MKEELKRFKLEEATSVAEMIKKIINDYYAELDSYLYAGGDFELAKRRIYSYVDELNEKYNPKRAYPDDKTIEEALEKYKNKLERK